MLRDYLSRRRPDKCLSLFVTAGFPSPDATVPLVQLLVHAGADLIELGVPFSDPLADGPTIQAASSVALQQGMTLAKVIEMAHDLAARVSVPIILMGYFNPILQFGVERFIAAAAKARVAGLIIPDLPVEESLALRDAAWQSGLSLIYLAAPNTPAARLSQIDRLTSGFVYATSVTGVTGARDQVAAVAVPMLGTMRACVHHPIFVGFGVSSAGDVEQLSQHCDGVIVGSALLRQIERHWGTAGGGHEIERFVVDLKSALRERPDGH